MKQSLRSRLLSYMLRQHGWVSSRQIQQIVMQNTSYLPRTAVRPLEEMAEDGELEVQIRGKMAWYRVKEGIKMPQRSNPNWIQGVGILQPLT